MSMLPNGNYERIISTIQHSCKSDDNHWRCTQFSWEKDKLRLEIENGDPYEDGYSAEIYINFCPFCGYKAKVDN